MFYPVFHVTYNKDNEYGCNFIKYKAVLKYGFIFRRTIDLAEHQSIHGAVHSCRVYHGKQFNKKPFRVEINVYE